MGSPVHIIDKNVVEVVPYAPRATFLRLDVGPFALLYVVVCCGYYLPFFAGDSNVKDESSSSSSSMRNMVAVLVALPIVLVLHMLVFLSTQWSVRFCCVVSQRRVASIDLAEVCTGMLKDKKHNVCKPKTFGPVCRYVRIRAP